MFCSNCGTQASGNFCAACGHALQAVAPKPAEIIPIDWSQEVCYERLIAIPEVRDRIANAGSQHRKHMSAEEFMSAFDQLVGYGVPMSKVVDFARPFYSKLGINTDKSTSRRLHLPPGKALVGVLCSMAKNGTELKGVEQAEGGCVLNAVMPSSIWSFSGDLRVTVRKEGSATHVETNIKIPGQKFDWGKSQRLMDELLDSIPAFAA